MNRAELRARFHNASRQDKARRANLYRKGQVRLWICGRKIRGPVELLGVTYGDEADEQANALVDERVWLCRTTFEGDEEFRYIGEYDLGTQVNEMEAIAWAAL